MKARLTEGWKVTRADYDAMREHARRCRPRSQIQCAMSISC